VTPQPESAILHAVRDHLRLQGFLVIRNVAGIGTHPGLADLLAVRDGVTIFIEVKTATGRLSEPQKRFRRDVEAHGATYVVARSVVDIAAVVGGCLLLDAAP